MGVGALTHVDPIPGGGALTEFRLEEPVLMAHAGTLGDHLSFLGTLNLEGLTMPTGVLTLGAWGEGFDDRRHPHTYAHELIVSIEQGFGSVAHPVRVSVSAGKGFVPFGSEDPMNRPALAFPVNHHWSQILERAVTMLGLRAGPVTVEAALFNGDEPERPGQWPLISRFGDSWSTRVTLTPTAGFDLEGSRAFVKSPENRLGAGTNQEKWHASARFERAVPRGRLYALAEWARTTEADGLFQFRSGLGEAAWSVGRSRVYYRFERTDRPEEERLLDPFRSLRPHLENSILGVTRWSVHTAGYGFHFEMVRRRLGVDPLLEGAYARVTDVGTGLFDAQSFYGRRDLWSLTLAVRLSTGMMHRMGHYGISGEGRGDHMEHMHAS